MNNAVVTHSLIIKDLAEFPKRPNLVDYAGVRADFDWAKARELLDGLPGGRGLNIAHVLLNAIERLLQEPEKL